MNTPFEYQDGESFLHRLHPNVKLAWVLLTLLVVLAPYGLNAGSFLGLALWLAFDLACWLAAGLDFRRFWVLFRILLFTFAFLVVSQALLYATGPDLFRIGPLPVKRDGLAFGLLLSLRILVAMSVMPVFISTTSPGKLMAALLRLGLPATPVLMFLSALTFTSTVFEMWQSIVDAQRLRGFDVNAMPLWQRARKGYIPIVVPLVLMLFRKGNDLDIALGTKGVGAVRRPTDLEPVSFGLGEAGFSLALLAMCLVFVAAFSGRLLS